MSHPASNELGEATTPASPFTSLSKSISGSSDGPPFVGNAFEVPKDIKSSLDAFTPFDPPSSCSFLVCSDSTRLERLLISSMKDWNCFRSSRGPKLMVHRVGKMSIATKSTSATPPTCRMTFSAATATAGSLVLIPFIKGMIFSCIVYLSRAVEELVFFEALFMIPSRPSLLEAGSFEAPQRIANASNPRTLMPRLLVLVKTDAITGNNSFLIVEKSRTGRMVGRLLSDASTMLCVGDSIARWIIGKMSKEKLAITDEIPLSTYHP